MRLVNPTGPRDAKIVLVGEAPGAEEDKLGMPFVGRSGSLLSKLLNQAGINRSDCYITNVVKIRPPNNRISEVDKTGKSLDQWISELVEEIQALQCPNIIVALGSTAMKALTDKKFISKQRGSVLESTRIKGLKVIPTYHPSSLLYGTKSSKEDPNNIVSDIPLVIFDLQKALVESTSPLFINRKSRHVIIAPTFQEVMNTLDLVSLQRFVSLDIETDMGANIIQCVGLAWSPVNAIVIPIYTNQPYWSEHEEIIIWERLSSILTCKTINKIIQNEFFERSVMYPWVGRIEPVWMDTMLGHHLCLPELKKDLGTIVSIYINEPYFKDDAKNSNYGNRATWEYNGKDCTTTYECAMAIRKDLERLELCSFYDDYQRPFSSIMWEAQNIGVLCDTGFVLTKRKEIFEKISIAQSKLNGIVGYEVNTSSHKQMFSLLYEKLKLPMKVNRKTRSPTANAEAIEDLRRKYPLPELNLILEIRKDEKILSTFLTGGKKGKEIWSPDGRIRCSWIMTGTTTGRLSSRKNIWGSGLNLQNIPTSEIRRMFISDKGSSFVKVDLSQVEARLVAYISNSYKMISVFEKGQDIHSMLASWIYKKPPETVGKGSWERSIAKQLVHAGNYGIGKLTFARIADIPTKEASWLLDQYDSQFSISVWHSNIRLQLQKDRTLITPMGRRRQFFGWWNDALFRSAYAFLPQSTAGDLINQAAVRIYKQLPPNSHILLQVHDELVIQCLDKDIQAIIDLTKKEIIKPININNYQVSIPVNIYTGLNWYDMEEVL